MNYSVNRYEKISGDELNIRKKSAIIEWFHSLLPGRSGLRSLQYGGYCLFDSTIFRYTSLKVVSWNSAAVKILIDESDPLRCLRLGSNNNVTSTI